MLIHSLVILGFVGLIHGGAYIQRETIDDIAALTNRMEQLEAKYEETRNENLHLRSLLDERQSRDKRDAMNDLKNSVATNGRMEKDLNTDIRRRMNLIESKVEKWSKKDADLEKRVGTVETMVNDEQSELTTRTLEARYIVQKGEALINEFSALTNETGSKKCAFSGVRSNVLLGSTESQIITYDQLNANKGKDFDIDSGIFTCEVPGIYYFSYTMRSYDGKHIAVSLVKNSKLEVSMMTDASDRKVMQSQSVMLDLDIGDRVWLELGPHEDFAVYSNNSKYITFNGFVLYPNYT